MDCKWGTASRGKLEEPHQHCVELGVWLGREHSNRVDDKSTLPYFMLLMLLRTLIISIGCGHNGQVAFVSGPKFMLGSLWTMGSLPGWPSEAQSASVAVFLLPMPFSIMLKLLHSQHIVAHRESGKSWDMLLS